MAAHVSVNNGYLTIEQTYVVQLIFSLYMRYKNFQSDSNIRYHVFKLQAYLTVAIHF